MSAESISFNKMTAIKIVEDEMNAYLDKMIAKGRVKDSNVAVARAEVEKLVDWLYDKPEEYFPEAWNAEVTQEFNARAVRDFKASAGA